MNDYRSILVHVSDSERSRKVLKCAASLAAIHGANLRAVHAVEPLHLGAFISPETAMTAAQLGEEARRQGLQTARERVLEAAQSQGMSIAFDSPGVDPMQAMTEYSRVTDLLVMGQPLDTDDLGPTRRLASRLLVHAGCPMLFVPAIGPLEGCGNRVLVAWSGTRESARALRDALPLLRRASSVEIIRFGQKNEESVEPLDRVAAYLHAFGVTPSCCVSPVREISFSERVLTPSVVDASIAELLLSRVSDINADLIVMGGYGHTRTYELVLGGVTQTILKSMTVPVLMSH